MIWSLYHYVSLCLQLGCGHWRSKPVPILPHVLLDFAFVPVPRPSLKPPSRLLASLSRSQTVSSTQASVRSACLMPSYTIVWLKMGFVVLRNTRVFWRLFRLVSGSTKLQEWREKKYGNGKLNWTVFGVLLLFSLLTIQLFVIIFNHICTAWNQVSSANQWIYLVSLWYT